MFLFSRAFLPGAASPELPVVLFSELYDPQRGGRGSEGALWSWSWS